MLGGDKVERDEVPAILVYFLLDAPIPTGLLALGRLLGLLPCPWSWVLLPLVSALFFLCSYLLAMAIIQTAMAAARWSP